ncbi:MAG: hypothetical protein MUC50_13905 [Myxococcota bacterium]|nr:hypothetical protein [Myxococcota bacterium]
MFVAVSGCLYEFPLKKAADTDTVTHTDTDTNPNTHTATETNSETTPISCPTGVAFVSSPAFTGVVFGTSGGTRYWDECPDEQVLVGFQGWLYSGSSGSTVHGTLGAICGKPSVSLVDGKCAVQVSAGAILPMHGSVGETKWTRMCPENEIIMGFRAWTGLDIDLIIFRCAPLLITPDENGYEITRGPYTDLSEVGGGATTPSDQTDCPDGQIATIAELYAAGYFRAIGLGCQTPSLL